jgi:hypothetical protein
LLTYSVWNTDTRQYDYYRGPGPGGTHAGSPPRRRSKTALGASPEDAAWKLPPSAVKTGSGDIPVGRIASIGNASALGIDTSDVVSVAVIAGLAYLAWEALR